MTDAVERMRASIQAHEEREKQKGHEAGIVFANHRADYEDLLILRKVVADDYWSNDELLNQLWLHYVEDGDFCAEEFREHLFGNEEAEPSGFFIGTFVRAALEKLEDLAEQAEKTAAA